MPRTARAVAIPSLLMILLAGCAGDLKPQARLTEASDLAAQRALADVAVSPSSWPTDNWWTAFGDEQLNQLVAQALEQSPSLRVAMARVRQAEAFRAGAESSLYPEVDGTFGTTRERYSANSVIPPPVRGTWQSFNSLNLGVGYEFDFWGKHREALDAALDARHALEVESYAARVMLSHAVVQAYIDLGDAYDQRDLVGRTLRQQLDILDLTQQRRRAQLDSQVDIKQAEATIPATRQTIAALSESIDLDQNRLAALLGRGPDRGLSIGRPALHRPDTVAIPSSLPAELLGHRPDVVAQRWRVEAAGHTIQVAKAQFYPNVNLSAFAGYQSLGYNLFTEASSRTLGFGPAVSLPIFEGGRLRANLAAQDAAYDIAVESYNQALADALRDISDQLTSLRWLRERLNQQQEAVKTAAEAWQLAKDRYGAGLASYIQVLLAESAATLQERQLIQLQSRALSLQAQLSRALGGGYRPEPVVADGSPAVSQ